MRKNILTSLFLLALVVSAPPLLAQSLTIDVKVPFGFVVENTTFPAGDYLVERVDTTHEQGMTLKSTDGRHHVYFLTEDGTAEKPPLHSELVFEEVGGQSYLSQVVVEGEGTIHQLVRSKAFTSALDKALGKSNRKSVKAKSTKKH